MICGHVEKDLTTGHLKMTTQLANYSTDKLDVLKSNMRREMFENKTYVNV